MQYACLKSGGAHFRIGCAEKAAGLGDPRNGMLVLQRNGDYDNVTALFVSRAVRDDLAEQVIPTMSALPIAIRTLFPDRI